MLRIYLQCIKSGIGNWLMIRSSFRHCIFFLHFILEVEKCIYLLSKNFDQLVLLKKKTKKKKNVCNIYFILNYKMIRTTLNKSKGKWKLFYNSFWLVLYWVIFFLVKRKRFYSRIRSYFLFSRNHFVKPAKEKQLENYLNCADNATNKTNIYSFPYTLYQTLL